MTAMSACSKKRMGLFGALLPAVLTAIVSFSSTALAVELRGAGATFPAPLYKDWI